MARRNLAEYSFKTYFHRVLIFSDVKYEVRPDTSPYFTLWAILGKVSLLCVICSSSKAFRVCQTECFFFFAKVSHINDLLTILSFEFFIGFFFF